MVSNEYTKDEMKSLSKTQQSFIRKWLRKGKSVWRYSGRFMYGKTCPAVRVGREDLPKRPGKVCWDNLGLDYVLYMKS